MQAVIVKAIRQEKEVLKLVDYCKKLDGTDVIIIDADESDSSYPERNNNALQKAFNLMGKNPFIWLEPDSIPIKKNWVNYLMEEYYKIGKPIMISSDSNPPHDLVGGIGVYGGIACKLIPKGITGIGWDGWMIKYINPLIGKTNLIQHTYGNYSSNNIEYIFPKDCNIIRKDCLIFHRDKYQGLIN